MIQINRKYRRLLSLIASCAVLICLSIDANGLWLSEDWSVLLDGALLLTVLAIIAALSGESKADPPPGVRNGSEQNSAERMCRAKDQFIAIIAFELRKPLAIIRRTVTDLAVRPHWAQDPAMQRLRRLLTHSADTMQSLADDLQHQLLVDNLLDWQLLKNGKIKLQPRVIELKYAIETAWFAVAGIAECKQIDFRMHLDPEAERVVADPSRLTLVFWNLFGNAVKFARMNGKITLSAVRTQSGIRISIADNGCGIAPDALPHIFEDSEIPPRTCKRRNRGLGLGLNIVRGIIEQHGGRIVVDSKGAGTGTTFTIVLNDALHHLPVRTEPKIYSAVTTG